MADDNEPTGAGMGTTGTPDTSGAAAIDEPDQANGATGSTRTGGALDDPDLPFERRPEPDDPVHRSPRYGQR
jgi:hypothetical protein